LPPHDAPPPSLPWQRAAGTPALVMASVCRNDTGKPGVAFTLVFRAAA
jgi:hypothetical protein